MVRGEKSAVESFAYQIILHLLLVDYWEEESQRNRNQRCDPSEVSSDWERASRDWQAEVSSFQFQLSNKITANFINYLAQRLPRLYARAKKTAILKTGLKQRFPENCPYTLEDILGEEET